jgi:hypothetical protein
MPHSAQRELARLFLLCPPLQRPRMLQIMAEGLHAELVRNCNSVEQATQVGQVVIDDFVACIHELAAHGGDDPDGARPN